jgi:dTDP-4-dehydrorhamnose reductase
MSNNKILLLGANGQVGWELQRSLAPLGELVACARNAPPNSGLHQLDITDTDALVAAIRAEKPALIVNAAAYTAVDKAESDQDAAFAANANAPRIIAAEAKALGALLVHYSTDYVFDGSKQSAYTETDTPNPQSIYGASKLAGEQAIHASGADAFIFRLSWVFGAHGNNFPKTMLRLARERNVLKVVADQHGRPTPAALAAEITATCLSAADVRPTGAALFHLAASGATTWFAFAKHTILIAQRLNLPGLRVDSERVEAIATTPYPTPAKRPTNSVMYTSKLEGTLGLVGLPHWDQYLQSVLLTELDAT